MLKKLIYNANFFFIAKIKNINVENKDNKAIKASKIINSLKEKPIVAFTDTDVAKKAKELVEDFSNNRFKIFQITITR